MSDDSSCNIHSWRSSNPDRECPHCLKASFLPSAPKMTSEKKDACRVAFDTHHSIDYLGKPHRLNLALDTWWEHQPGKCWRACWSACQAASDERAKVLLDELEFYADRRNTCDDIVRDGGSRARAAIQKYREGK